MNCQYQSIYISTSKDHQHLLYFASVNFDKDNNLF